jgi:outer membrane protein OmpA-like peptidoglycan-associated protein
VFLGAGLRPRLRLSIVVGAALGIILGFCGRAQAQQKTLYLDRLSVGGAPDDGIAIWRPYEAPKSRFFAQMGLGLTLRPLRASTVATDNNPRLRQFNNAVVGSQFIDYATVGAEVAGRAAFLVTLPFTLFQSGTDPAPLGVRGVGDLQPFALLDARLDFRGTVYRTEDRKWLFGAGMSFWIPTGSRFSYGGDGATSTALNLSVETYVREVIVAVNTGLHWRPTGVVGELAVGDEWTLGVGGWLPLREGKYRVGGSIVMSTGTESLRGQSGVEKSTFFSARNTPIEWMAEGRMALDPTKQLWAGAGIGTLLHAGYGAPDVRVIAMIGYHLPIEESDASAPERRMKAIRERIAHEGADADHDGIPDDVDLCPSDPEDHLEPDPSDGCPKPPDRDNDGIPDAYDKCPDVPEDKDGIEDMNGCPEVDYDNDGVPDVSDACPREPGTPSTDPKTNGCPQFIKRVTGSTEIEILKQIQFDTGKATIKPGSFPIMDEIVKLLKANPDIKRLTINGHTDNRGAVEMNNKLSQDRADSVMKYLTSHGIDEGRLEAHGFGPSQPIDTNDTDAGRQNNRRVQFHITQQGKP